MAKGEKPSKGSRSDRRSLKAIDPQPQPTVVEAVGSVRADLMALTSNYREGLSSALVKAGGISLRVQKNPKEWQDLITDPENAKRLRGTKPDQKAPFPSVLHCVVEGKRKARIKTVSKYNRAIAPLLKKGISIDTLAEVIKDRGGIEALCRAHAKQSVKVAKRNEHRSKLTLSALPTGDLMGEDREEEDFGLEDRSPTKKRPATSTPEAQTAKKPKTVTIEVTDMQFPELMDLEVGEIAGLRIKRIEGPGGWKRFRLKSIRRK